MQVLNAEVILQILSLDLYRYFPIGLEINNETFASKPSAADQLIVASHGDK